jgi:hypothetical protein
LHFKSKVIVNKKIASQKVNNFCFISFEHVTNMEYWQDVLQGAPKLIALLQGCFLRPLNQKAKKFPMIDFINW